ncbi:unnamed protein product [Chrysodeixis includens]|uniref:Uncharacterized protein n=1 Tax=Chrysodeixis includens TaxID=689277 RepID=A0A9N8Q2K0_CHRIL|nr:unnamed protein product [Chrysodeixis includens]
MLVQTPVSLEQFTNISRTLCPHNNMFTDDEDTCVFDNERDILYDGYYLTMTRRGGITLTQDTFPVGFYIVFIVKTSDEDCTDKAGNNTLPRVAHYLGWAEEEVVQLVTNDGRVKTFSFRIIQTISYQEYAIAAGAVLAFFSSFYVAFIIAVFCRKKVIAQGHGQASEEEGLSTPVPPNELPSSGPARRRRGHNPLDLHSGESSRQCLVGDGDVCEQRTCPDGSSSSDTESDFSTLDDVNTDKDIYRLGGKLCVANLARCRPRVLSARSKMYLWNVLTVAVFYTLPVIQLVVTYQRLLNQSGNQDLCYFNFLCAHPLLVLSDFNHVYSNLGYVLLGLLFLMQVWRRHSYHHNKTPEQVWRRHSYHHNKTPEQVSGLVTLQPRVLQPGLRPARPAVPPAGVAQAQLPPQQDA